MDLELWECYQLAHNDPLMLLTKVVYFESSPVNTVGVNPSLADAHLIVMPHGITFLKVGSRFIEEFAYSVFYFLNHFHRVTFWHIRPLKSFTIFLTAQLHKTNFSLKTNTVFLLVRSSQQGSISAFPFYDHIISSGHSNCSILISFLLD